MKTSYRSIHDRTIVENHFWRLQWPIIKIILKEKPSFSKMHLSRAFMKTKDGAKTLRKK